jgi:transmembrane sensor
MELTKERVIELTFKYLGNELTEADRVELDSWLADPYNKLRFEERIRMENILGGITMMEAGRRAVEEREWTPEMTSQTGIIIGLGEKVPAGRRRMRWMTAAAAAVLIGIGAIWLTVHKVSKPDEARQSTVVHELLPGGNKAILTLAGGGTITLDSAGIGAISQQGNMKVTKVDSGEIAYQGSAVPGNDVLYNSISTPRGGQYKLVMADGSKVWLNAASVLRYPTTFTGTTRTVELVQGEAYFEVVHSTERPFIVRVSHSGAADNDLSVQVLGTSFDVNAYPDEPDTKTTLLSGAVRVAKGGQAMLLHPGQQARTNTNSPSISIENEVEVSGVVAWKDGLFSFDRAGIEAIMRQLARWYDVDVSYEGSIPIRQFVGKIPRNMPAADVLKALELNNVHFRIDGRKIVVMP